MTLSYYSLNQMALEIVPAIIVDLTTKLLKIRLNRSGTCIGKKYFLRYESK
jgi:hypothetical protein